MQSLATCEPARWPLRSLIIGDATRTEFRASVDLLNTLTEARFVAGLAHTAPCEAIVAESEEPDIVVLLSSRPGDFTHDSVEQLRQRAPLTRVIGLLGSWCEGEARTGHPWAAVPRVYWHQGPCWLARELSLLSGGQCGTLSLPLTATEEDRSSVPIPASQRTSTGRIGVVSPSIAMLEVISEACQALGYTVQPLPHHDHEAVGGLSAGIADQTTAAPDDLRQLVGSRPNLPWIALAGFPRAEDVARLQAAGAWRVLSKPLLLDDLRIALSDLPGSVH